MAGNVTIIPHRLFQPQPKHYKITNWPEYQHYTKRNPSWIKLHCKILRSRRWLEADEPTRLLMIVVMLIAAENCGVFPASTPLLKKLGNFRKTPNLKPLIENGFIVEMLADASTPLDRERDRVRDREERGLSIKEGSSKEKEGSVAI